MIYYERLLTHKVYEDILLIQRYMLNYYEEINNEEMIIKIYKDMDLYYRNELDPSSSNLIASQKE